MTVTSRCDSALRFSGGLNRLNGESGWRGYLHQLPDRGFRPGLTPGPVRPATRTAYSWRARASATYTHGVPYYPPHPPLSWSQGRAARRATTLGVDCVLAHPSTSGLQAPPSLRPSPGRKDGPPPVYSVVDCAGVPSPARSLLLHAPGRGVWPHTHTVSRHEVSTVQARCLGPASSSVTLRAVGTGSPQLLDTRCRLSQCPASCPVPNPPPTFFGLSSGPGGVDVMQTQA